MPRSHARRGVPVLCCLLAAGCGDDNPQSPGPPPADTTPPYVTIVHPAPEEIVGTLLQCEVSAADSAGVDSVFVSLQDSTGLEVRGQAFGSTPPFRFDIAADLLTLGRYSVCGRAFDRKGNRSEWTCAVAHVYPPVTLRRDDGTADFGLEVTIPFQTAAVFENPYDVPVTVEAVDLYIWVGSAIDAPFRVVLWGVSGDAPLEEVEGTPLRLFRGPFGDVNHYAGFHTVISAHGKIAAGLQQTDFLPLRLGYDSMTVPPPRTYWVAAPAGSNVWVPIENSPAGGLDTPFIRVTVRANGLPATVLAPVPVPVRRAVPAQPMRAADWRRVH